MPKKSKLHSSFGFYRQHSALVNPKVINTWFCNPIIYSRQSSRLVFGILSWITNQSIINFRISFPTFPLSNQKKPGDWEKHSKSKKD